MDEVLDLLALRAGEVAVDCTLGRGGHALAIAQRLGPAGTLIALDADPRNLEYAEGRLAEAPCKVELHHANFGTLRDILGDRSVDVLLADLGVSTNQLTSDTHGLSFSVDGPLDMRLDPDLRTTAADILRTTPEKQLADLIYQNGDERFSRRIAKRIVETRRQAPIRTTAQLAELVRFAIPKRLHDKRIHPATRTFQALRMAVNRERENLEALLDSVPQVLSSGGRCGLISFHSHEDRPVKHRLNEWSSLGLLEKLTKRPITPGEAELTANPRSRSAKLRGARRVG